MANVDPKSNKKGFKFSWADMGLKLPGRKWVPLWPWLPLKPMVHLNI